MPSHSSMYSDAPSSPVGVTYLSAEYIPEGNVLYTSVWSSNLSKPITWPYASWYHTG